jgi:hypothetical protein
MEGPTTVLVNSSSATQSRPWETDVRYSQAMNRNHSNLVKYSFKDQDYIVVLEHLRVSSREAKRIIRPRFSEISSSPEPEPASSKKISGQGKERTRLSARYIHPQSLLELLRTLFADQFTIKVSSLGFSLSELALYSHISRMKGVITT